MKIAVIAMAFVASAAFASSTTKTAPAPATQEASKDKAAHPAGHATAPKDAKMADCKEKNADGTCKEAAKK